MVMDRRGEYRVPRRMPKIIQIPRSPRLESIDLERLKMSNLRGRNIAGKRIQPQQQQGSSYIGQIQRIGGYPQ